MYVIIDSNIIIANYTCKYSAFKLFCKHFPEKNITTYISKVSIEEIFKHHKQDIAETAKKYNAAVRGINKTSVEIISPLEQQYQDKQHNNYKDYFYKLINSNQIQILDYPLVSHEDIIKYSVQGRKPFKTKDTGYKDYLIWSSITSLSKQTQRPIVLITKDSDFVENNDLHNDYKLNLQELSISPNRVTICTSINEFNNIHLRDIYKIVELKDFFADPHHQYQLEHSFKDKLIQYLSNYMLDESLFDDYIDPVISEIIRFEKFTISQLDALNDYTIAVRFEVLIDAIIDVHIHKSDYYSGYDGFDIITLVDENYNDFFVSAEDSAELRIIGNFTCDKYFHVEDIDIVEIENQ